MRGPSTPTPWTKPLPSPIGPHPLDALLTPERAARLRQVLARRTGRLTVVVEDSYDPHNATAIVRTCDAFGLSELHVTTARNAFKVNDRVSQGTHRYLDLHVHPDITAAYAALRARGFRILVSDLAAGATVGPENLRALAAEQPLALVFGNEGSGVTPAASAGADGFFLIPMAGFAQSLNVSVSVAVTLYAVRGPELSADAPGDLPPERQRALFEHWVHEHKGRAADLVMKREAGRHGEDLESYRA
jgi:tRNA (guanosine-2'-O-)-methyltransferase